MSFLFAHHAGREMENNNVLSSFHSNNVEMLHVQMLNRKASEKICVHTKLNPFFFWLKETNTNAYEPRQLVRPLPVQRIYAR